MATQKEIQNAIAAGKIPAIGSVVTYVGGQKDFHGRDAIILGYDRYLNAHIRIPSYHNHEDNVSLTKLKKKVS